MLQFIFDPLSMRYYAFQPNAHISMHMMSKLEIDPIAKRRLLILSAASPTCALVGRWLACATMAQCHRTLVRIFTFHNQEADSLILETSQFQTSEIQIRT